MILLVILVAFAQKSLFQQVIAHPDPNNGYDDYVRAADFVRAGQASVYTGWTPDQYSRLSRMKQESIRPRTQADDVLLTWSNEEEAELRIATELRDKDFLAIQQLASSRFARAIELIEIGNQKPCFDPREVTNSATVFPELAEFRTLAKLASSCAYAEFARGDSGSATDSLIQGLVFARQIGSGTLLGELVSVALQAMLFARFQAHLADLSGTDAERVIRFVDSAIAQPSGLARVIDGEAKYALASFDELLSEKPDDEAGSEFDSIMKYLAGLNSAQRGRLRSTFASAVREAYGKMRSMVSGPEDTWQVEMNDLVPTAPETIGSDTDWVDAMLNDFMPAALDSIANAELRSRAQLRLLGLHARIVLYRWHHGRLPEKLKEAVPEPFLYDPMGKEPFHYEVTGDSYRLYSKGLSSTGPVELRYRRPPILGQDDKIPPRLPKCLIPISPPVPRTHDDGK